MKRLLIIMFAVAMSLSLLLYAGCADSSPTDTEQPETEQPDAEQNGADETDEKDEPDDQTQDKEISKMYITVDSQKLEVTLEKSPSTDELIELLKQGDIVFTAEENGGFELYGDIGHTLSADDSRITAQAGDVILYSRRYICIFFGSNSWSYTKIGKINGYTAAELRNIFGGRDSAQITLSLE